MTRRSGDDLVCRYEEIHIGFDLGLWFPPSWFGPKRCELLLGRGAEIYVSELKSLAPVHGTHLPWHKQFKYNQKITKFVRWKHEIRWVCCGMLFFPLCLSSPLGSFICCRIFIHTRFVYKNIMTESSQTLFLPILQLSIFFVYRETRTFLEVNHYLVWFVKTVCRQYLHKWITTPIHWNIFAHKSGAKVRTAVTRVGWFVDTKQLVYTWIKMHIIREYVPKPIIHQLCEFPVQKKKQLQRV